MLPAAGQCASRFHLKNMRELNNSQSKYLLLITFQVESVNNLITISYLFVYSEEGGLEKPTNEQEELEASAGDDIEVDTSDIPAEFRMDEYDDDEDVGGIVEDLDDDEDDGNDQFAVRYYKEI